MMDDTLRVGKFEIPRNQRVLLIAKNGTFSDALVQRVEGDEVLFFEARNNVGKRRFFQILVEDLVGLEYEP